MIERDPGTAEAISFVLNGGGCSVTVERDALLLYVLRNDLGLKGSRFGCGMGLCGACMVLVDGRPMPSCDLPLYAVAGKRVTTIEGMQAADGLHPLQQAFIDEGAGQCGYCLSGILISAMALLERNPDPSDADIRTALEPNICRCGAHARVIRAIRRAAGAAS